MTDHNAEWPAGVLNREATLKLLREHNEWRRGASTPQTDPRMLGLAIDAAIAALTAAPAASEGEDVRLWDSQWVNVVNHANCYEDFTKEEAVAHAVKMTEQYMRANITAGFPNTRPAAQVAATPKHDRLQGDDKVLWGVVANAGRLSSQRAYRWVHVMEAAGLGSTSAAALCVRFGFNPDDYIGGDEPDSDDEAAPTPKHDEGRDDWIDAGVLRNQLAGYAEPECRECDGSGVYYGNVCICNCVLDAIPKHEALATQPAARRVTDGESAIWALRQILHDLPSRRDWLDPQLEAVARDLVTRNPYADLTQTNESFAQPAEGVSRSGRDFPGDAEHENGDYENRCVQCDEVFTGYKRRVVCRVCAERRGDTP